MMEEARPTQPERVPQWTHAETAELLAVRAELDQMFMETKRNKPLWDDVSRRMHRRGFPRSADQCKSKWKNLLTRFKGSEAMEAETTRHFPFKEEMQRILSDRMARILHRHQGGEENEEEQGKGKRRRRKERKGGGEGEEVVGVLRAIIRRHLEMEDRWMREVEEREEERRAWEQEWRRSMEGLLVERMEMERRWREAEEERKAREEERAERRHALVTAILTKLADKGF